MNYKDNFKRELTNLSLEVDNQEDFFRTISSELQEKGYVKQTFEKAIIEREKNYPTGLQLDNFTIAIPHTDVEHVKKPFVAIYRLTQQINFYQMGTDDEVVPVKDILVLGIDDPKKQVGLLSSLMQCFSEKNFVKQYKNTAIADSILKLIKNTL